MHKLSRQTGSEWVEHSFAPTFDREATAGDGTRLVVGVPAGNVDVLPKLLECTQAPFYLLYVLHTPRGEADPGRYQSPKVAHANLRLFLTRYTPLLANDARHDLWVHSPASSATLIWDRHNLLYGYGRLDCYESSLRALGFANGLPLVPVPNAHHYREEYDLLALDIMSAFEWRYSPLRAEDEQ